MKLTLIILALLALIRVWWFPIRKWYFKRTMSRRIRKEIAASDELITAISKQDKELLETFNKLQKQLADTPLAVLSGANRYAARREIEDVWRIRMQARSNLVRANQQRDDFLAQLKQVEEM